MSNKFVDLDKFGIISRIPSNINDLLDGKEIERLENLLSRKYLQIKKEKGDICIKMNNVTIAKLRIRVDRNRKKFVVEVE